MKAYEVFRRLGNDEIDALVLDACTDEEVPDKLAGGVLQYQAIPLKRFSKLADDTRRAYVRRTVRDKRASDLALYVLSSALTHGKAEMVSDFLEAVGLPHEGPSISFENEIPEPEKAKLDSGIDAVLAKYPPRSVSIYLHAFSSQPDAHWKGLEEKLEKDERLALEDKSNA
jgi:hypothetical protein